MNELMYRIQGLTQTYGGRQVLEVDQLEIRRGEILALVGPSGAGKSTLLRLLNFLELPATGSIEFQGEKFDQCSEISLELRRKVTTVFQLPVLLDRSVWDNVTFGLRLRGNRDGRLRTEAALAEVGLLSLARQRARTLSGGEAQRVALARALVLQPEVLLLDEPTANLDPANVAIIERIAHRLNAAAGTTVVLVTHNVFQARRLAHRAAFLLDGRVVEVGESNRFYESPKDSRTAAFVRGDMIY